MEVIKAISRHLRVKFNVHRWIRNKTASILKPLHTLPTIKSCILRKIKTCPAHNNLRQIKEWFSWKNLVLIYRWLQMHLKPQIWHSESVQFLKLIRSTEILKFPLERLSQPKTNKIVTLFQQEVHNLPIHEQESKSCVAQCKRWTITLPNLI